MQTITLPATKARTQFFELIDDVYLGKKIVQVKKGSKIMVKLVPAKEERTDWKVMKKALDALSNQLTDMDYREILRSRDPSVRFPDW